MKNPYDSYLLRRDKPKLIGFYCGKPVYDGDENSAEFRFIVGEKALPKCDNDTVPQIYSIRNGSDIGDGFAFLRVTLLLLLVFVVML